MQLSHSVGRLSASFDEANLVGSAGLVPAVALAGRIGLTELVDTRLTVPGAKGGAGTKLVAVLAGMVAGADSIDDLDVLRHGAMGKLFTGVRAPSTLGSFLRSFRFGHVRQIDAVASRTVALLAARVPDLLPAAGQLVWLDVDDTIKAVFGRSKQGAEHGYTRIRGLNAQIATVSGPDVAPVIAAARLRRGAASSAHGAVRLVRDAVATLRRAHLTGQVLVRADSAYYQQALITAIVHAGCWYSIGARLNTSVRAKIATIDDKAWIPIVYPNAIVDPDTGELVSGAEVAEVPYTAFTSHGSGQVTGRLIVRRVPERNTTKLEAASQDGLFPLWRYHAVFTNNPAALVEAEKAHRGHAVIEQVFADLKAGPLAHLPSKSFNANSVWLAIATIAFNLTRALGVTAGGRYARAETATIRAHIIHTPARVSTSARKQHLHLPTRWPGADSWQRLWTAVMTT